jgi:hypothetical protein
MTFNFNFFSLLTLIFVVAKLFDIIDWSWWIVFSPILGVASLFILVITLALVLPIKISRK